MRSKLAFGIVLLPHVLFGVAVVFWSKHPPEDDRVQIALWAAQLSIVVLPLVLRPLRPWGLFAAGAAAVVAEYVIALATHKGCPEPTSRIDRCEDFAPAFYLIGILAVPLSSAVVVGIGQLVARLADRYVVQPLARRGLGAVHFRVLVALWLILACAGVLEVIWLGVQSARPCDGSLVVTRDYLHIGEVGPRSPLASEPDTNLEAELARNDELFTPLGEVVIHRRAERKLLINRTVAVTLPRSCDGAELDVVGPAIYRRELERETSSGDLVIADATNPDEISGELAFRRVAPGPLRSLPRFAPGFVFAGIALGALAVAFRRVRSARQYFAKPAHGGPFRARADDDTLHEREALRLARSNYLWAAAGWMLLAAAILAYSVGWAFPAG